MDELSKRILIKDMLIAGRLTKENKKDTAETPCPRILGRPMMYEYEPEKYEVVVEL